MIIRLPDFASVLFAHSGPCYIPATSIPIKPHSACIHELLHSASVCDALPSLFSLGSTPSTAGKIPFLCEASISPVLPQHFTCSVLTQHTAP